MSSNDLIGERVRVSTSGPMIACEVIREEGEEGGEMNYIVEDLHTGNRFPIRESKIDQPEDWTDTLYVWQDRADGGWDTQYSSRDRDEVEAERNQKWSSSGAGGNRIKEEEITL